MKNSVSARLLTIIVTYNGAFWIRKCVQSLLNSYTPADILIVDNCSTDETLSIVSEYNLKIIENEKNLGFGSANNLGLKYALGHDYDFVFLLNQDAWIEKYTIQNLISCYTEEHGILSPLHLDGTGEQFDLTFQVHIQQSRSLSEDLKLNTFRRKLYEVPFINAAAWLMSRTTLLIVGGFDPLFKHYGEDNDYANRVGFHGLKIGVCSDSRIYHDRSDRDSPDDLATYQTLQVGYIAQIKNPSQKPFGVFLYILRKHAARLVVSIFRRNMNFVFLEWRLISHLMNKMPKILRHRSLTKKTGATFVNS